MGGQGALTSQGVACSARRPPLPSMWLPRVPLWPPRVPPVPIMRMHCCRGFPWPEWPAPEAICRLSTYVRSWWSHVSWGALSEQGWGKGWRPPCSPDGSDRAPAAPCGPPPPGPLSARGCEAPAHYGLGEHQSRLCPLQRSSNAAPRLGPWARPAHTGCPGGPPVYLRGSASTGRGPDLGSAVFLSPSPGGRPQLLPTYHPLCTLQPHPSKPQPPRPSPDTGSPNSLPALLPCRGLRAPTCPALPATLA